MSDPPQARDPAPRNSRGGYWALAMVFLTIACLALPIVLIRSAMRRVRNLSDAGELVTQKVRSVAEAFRTGTVETRLRSYATEVKGVSRFQFAELRQLESFERTDTASIAWGLVPLPDVVVEARGQVLYTYALDLQKPWELRLHDETVDVFAPFPEPGVPALDPSTLTFEVKRGSVIRDEAAVRAALQAGLSSLLMQRAREHIALVKETGRNTTADFVRNFLISSYDDAAGYQVNVRFSGEPLTSATATPLSVEGKR